ncbi:MAG: phosphotransferase [Pseudomonadota bacterium]
MTPQWLTAQLQAAGLSARVTDFAQADVGTGQVGRCVRYDLQFAEEPQAQVPRSLVAKFSSDDPTSKDTGQALLTYKTEVNFYRSIAPQVGIRVPRCYFAAIDAANREHLILMDNMAPAQQGDQIQGCSPAVVRQAVMELVGLQAPTWRDARWYKLLGRVQDGPFADMRGLYNSTMPGFVERYAPMMDARHIGLIEAIGAAGQCPMFEFHGEHFALEHYDFRLDNVLIGGTASAPEVTTVDWQSVRVGKPLSDVAYFIGSALPAEVRRTVEMDILREYHEALLRAGVTDFSWEACYREYRKGIFSGFAVSVVSPVLVQRTERGDKMFTTMATRYAEMALDHQAEEFLS